MPQEWTAVRAQPETPSLKKPASNASELSKRRPLQYGIVSRTIVAGRRNHSLTEEHGLGHVRRRGLQDSIEE